MHLTTAWTGRRPELWPPFLFSPADCLLLLKVPFYSGLGQRDWLLGHPQSPRAPYGDALKPVAASQGGRKPGRGELQSPEQPGFSREALEQLAVAGARVEPWPCFFLVTSRKSAHTLTCSIDQRVYSDLSPRAPSVLALTVHMSCTIRSPSPSIFPKCRVIGITPHGG